MSGDGIVLLYVALLGLGLHTLWWCFSYLGVAMVLLESGEEEDLHAPVADLGEKWKLLPHFMQLRGLMRQHIDSFDYFVNREIKNIVAASSNYEVSTDP